MVKETEIEETLGLVIIIFIIGGISIYWRAFCPPFRPPLAKPISRYIYKSLIMGISIRALLAKLLLDLQQGSSFAETFLFKIFLPIFQKKFPTEQFKKCLQNQILKRKIFVILSF